MTTTAAYVGGMVMPAVVGAVAGAAGIRAGMATLLAPAAAVGMLLAVPASIRAMGWGSPPRAVPPE